MFVGALAVLLITLGLGQLVSTYLRLRGVSLTGSSRFVGYSLALLLVTVGGLILPGDWTTLWLVPLAGVLTVLLLLWGGSVIAPPPDPNRLFRPGHSAHADCQRVEIPDGEHLMPGFLLYPPDPPALLGTTKNPCSEDPADRQARKLGPTVLIVPGAGDTKISFKWRLVEALLAAGLTVLTIDPPGHGDYRRRPMAFPDCLSAIPAAIAFLQGQPGLTHIGLLGISLGGALTLRSLAAMVAKTSQSNSPVAALVVIATPTHLNYSRSLFYQELWGTIFGGPSLSLLREMSFKQVRQSWYTGGYRSRHTTTELITRLNPLKSIEKLAGIPTLLVYSRRDRVSPPSMAVAMQRAAPWATEINSRQASHVMLTLIPEINRQIAGWLKAQLHVSNG